MIRLERRMWTRLLTGARLQGLIALFALLIALRALGQATGGIDDDSLPIGGTLLVLLALVAILAVGAAGNASADDAGVRWRYYLPHSYAWNDIERVELEAVGVSLFAVRHMISVRVRGRRHRITPASDGGAGRIAFGRALAAAAAERGIEVIDRWR